MIIPGATQADLMFTTGPETVVAGARVVCIGRVSDYEKIITDAPGSSGDMPSNWIIRGEVVDLEYLKGGPPDLPLRFEKPERSFMLPPPESRLYWEPYADLNPEGDVVVFLTEGEDRTEVRVIPNGTDEMDLSGLVRDIVRIESVKEPGERFEAWQTYLGESLSDDGRKAALRSMFQLEPKWPKLVPLLTMLLANTSASGSFRGYTYGIVAYHVTNETWGEKRHDVVKFLTSRFSSERDPDLVIQYLSSLSAIADYCYEEEFREQRQPILTIIEQAVRSRPSLFTPDDTDVDPEDEEYYQETRNEILAGPDTPIPSEEP